MKKLRLNLKSKTALITIVAVTSGLVVGGLGVSKSEAALDWLGLEQKLANHDEQLENQNDRINNTEKDVSDLQTNTNTAPSTTKTVVKEVVTQNPTLTQQPTPSTPPTAPTPITVTNYEVIPNGDEFNCKYTYSDGTTYTFRWKWSSTISSSQGPVQTINTSGDFCDNRAIGQNKTS